MENRLAHLSGIRDNHTRGKVADFLKEKIVPGSALSIVSAYFTVHAYDALREALENAGHPISGLCSRRRRGAVFLRPAQGIPAAVARTGCRRGQRQRKAVRSIRSAHERGADMRHYDGLIQQALASIERTFQRRAAMGLLAGRGSLLPAADEAPTADQGQFELVTWLVILAPE